MRSIWCFVFLLFFGAALARCPSNPAMMATLPPNPATDMWHVHMIITDQNKDGSNEKTHVIEHWETRVFDHRSCTINRTVYLRTDDARGTYIYKRLYRLLKDQRIQMFQHDIKRPLVMTQSNCDARSIDSKHIRFDCHPNTIHEIEIVHENTFFMEKVRENNNEFTVMFNAKFQSNQPEDVINARRAFEAGEIKSFITDPFILFVYYDGK